MNRARREVLPSELSAQRLPDCVQDRLARILDDYLVAAERGAPISPEELLRRHPEDADHLRVYLSGIRIFHNAVNGSCCDCAGPVDGGPETAQRIGDFRLTREIGRGGMGVVYEAVQISLRRHVALKILPFATRHDARQIGRFRNEAQAAAQVQHPNIVPVFAIGEHEGMHYYAMQLIDGQSLSALLEEERASCGSSAADTTEPDFCRTVHDARPPYAPPDGETPFRFQGNISTATSTDTRVRMIARLGIQAADALHAAHEYGVVHRDVKPSNLLLDKQGKLWVTDFGLARCRESERLTRTGDIMGTARYMSPEQAQGRTALSDHRTDIFSLGITLYELATLRHPAGDATDAQLVLDRSRFSCKSLRHWNPHIPLDFQTIVLKSIAEFPHERYATAKEMADDLRRFLAGQPILASPPGRWSRAIKWAARHRGFVAAVAAVLVVACVGLFANLLLIAREKAHTERALVAANANLHQAHAVLDRFGSQLVDQLAAIPGAESVRYQLLEDSLRLYQQLEHEAAGDPALISDVAFAYGKMGSLSEKLGDYPAALEKHLAARAIWQKRVDEDPASVMDLRNLALAHNNIGMVLSELDRCDEALASLRDAEALLRSLAADQPRVRELSADLALALGNQGLVLTKTGHQTEAAGKLRAAIAIQERLLDQTPEQETALRGLAASLNNLASLQNSSDSKGALTCYRKAIRLQRRLVELQPINRIYRADLARTYNNLGYMLAQLNDWDHAEGCYANAIELQRQLVSASPQAACYRRDLAVSYNNLGLAQNRSRQPMEAESSFRRALGHQKWLHSSYPADAGLVSNLGSIFNNLATVLDEGRRFAEAEDAFRQAIEYQRQAFTTAPDESAYGTLLDNHYQNYSRCLKRQQKLDAAAKAARERDEIAHQFANRPAIN